jgi:hypothetical protein
MLPGTLDGASASSPSVEQSGTSKQDTTLYSKYILLARRKPGMSPEAFKDYYESHHVKLMHLLRDAPLKRYFRRYLHSQGDFDPATAGEQHDVITELWCSTLADMHAVMARFENPEVSAKFARDEENLFDRSSIKTYLVEEHETDLTAVSTAARTWNRHPTDNVVKSILIAHRRSGMPMDEFKGYYENHHSKIIYSLHNPPLVRYFRRYLDPQTNLDRHHGGDPPSVVMEMWYPTREDMYLVDRSFYESDKVQLFIEDEDKLFERPSMKFYVAEEHESDRRYL